MKTAFTIAVALAVAAASPHAVSAGDAKPSPRSSAGADGKFQTGTASGTVRRIDTANRTVTIAHGPIAGLDMPGMTMAFPVADKLDLSGLKAQQKVEFTVRYDGSKFLITQIR